MISVLEDKGAKRKILLCLAGAYVGKLLGLLEKDKLTPKEIASYTGLNEKVTRARLSELKKAGLVIKYGEGLYGFTKASIKELFGEKP
ncbi:MAG TPA: ArsR family transcriptional regulator [Nitrososphaeria archaeon]|nr:ArsR family transcriptional regulator [Nitrososphaeria archaeon]